MFWFFCALLSSSLAAKTTLPEVAARVIATDRGSVETSRGGGQQVVTIRASTQKTTTISLTASIDRAVMTTLSRILIFRTHGRIVVWMTNPTLILSATAMLSQMNQTEVSTRSINERCSSHVTCGGLEIQCCAALVDFCEYVKLNLLEVFTSETTG